MERSQISAIAHQEHPIAAPLSDVSVARLLDRALPNGDERLLDLGCGEAAWLVRALTGRAGTRGHGVDIDPESIARARQAISDARLGERLTVHVQDVSGLRSPDRYDVVLSVGAAHAFGGLSRTLAAVRSHLAPGGRAIVGDCFWEREPGKTTLDAGFGVDDYTDLATTVDRIREDGWTPVYGHVSTLAEWDEYEWCWTGSLAQWALDHRDHQDGEVARDTADRHRAAWLHGYRGTLGFVTLVLRSTED